MLTVAPTALAMVICLGSGPACSALLSEEGALPPILFSLFCVRHPDDCQPHEDRRTEELLSAEQRRRQMDLANSAVNVAIAPETATAFDNDWTILPHVGNCGDYAVSKRHLLLQFGWPSSSLLLAEVVVRATGEHHLVLLVREARDTFVLDNLAPRVSRVAEVLDKYTFVRVQSDQNPRFWVRAGRDEPGGSARAAHLRSPTFAEDETAPEANSGSTASSGKRGYSAPRRASRTLGFATDQRAGRDTQQAAAAPKVPSPTF
jgi:predicted transglutaminase-like cysteine proteinase